MKQLTTGLSVAFLFCAVTACGGPAPEGTSINEAADPETRVIRYLESHVKAGEPVIVSDLHNRVFKSPEERAVLDRLYNAFFKIPLSVVQFQESSGRIPTLEELSGQFGFTVPGEMNVILKVMESDPRIPPFIDRNPSTGEITRIDAEAIRSHPQFGRILDRSVGGWEGRRVPSFRMPSLSQGQVGSADVSAGPYVIYFWFSQCPPCVKTAPLLVELEAKYASRGFRIIGVNADQVLQLPFTDNDRATYLKKAGIRFPNGHMTADIQREFGGVAVFPTFFFVDSDGVVVKRLVNFQEMPVLESTIRTALGER
jgi:thiol-disulfide isomerase/thioredoxin